MFFIVVSSDTFESGAWDWWFGIQAMHRGGRDKMVDFSMAISVDRSVILGETASSKSTVVPNQCNTSQFTAKRIEMSEPTVDGGSNLQHPRSELYVYIYIYKWKLFQERKVFNICIYIYTCASYITYDFLITHITL